MLQPVRALTKSGKYQQRKVQLRESTSATTNNRSAAGASRWVKRIGRKRPAVAVA